MKKWLAGMFTLVIFISITDMTQAATATLRGCVYNKNTDKPIQGATIFVQPLDSSRGLGAATDANGCVDGINVNLAIFQGDYIEASLVKNKRVYLQQYRIPNILLEKTYTYDFFLDVPSDQSASSDNA